jgi:hypothetical protein
MGDQSQMRSEAKGRVHLTPPISSTAHASREAGRCSVGLPHCASGSARYQYKVAEKQTEKPSSSRNIASWKKIRQFSDVYIQ